MAGGKKLGGFYKSKVNDMSECPNDYFDEYPLDVLFDSPKCVTALKNLIFDELSADVLELDIDPDEDFSLDVIGVKVSITHLTRPVIVNVNDLYDIIKKNEPEKWEKYGAAWKAHFKH